MCSLFRSTWGGSVAEEEQRRDPLPATTGQAPLTRRAGRSSPVRGPRRGADVTASTSAIHSSTAVRVDVGQVAVVEVAAVEQDERAHVLGMGGRVLTATAPPHE